MGGLSDDDRKVPCRSGASDASRRRQRPRSDENIVRTKTGWFKGSIFPQRNKLFLRPFHRPHYVEESKMVEVRNDPYGDRVVVKNNTGRNLAIAAVIILAIVGLLFATGFWSADVKDGALPKVAVEGGKLPDVDVDSKEVVVGTEKKEIDVPVVGVKDNGEK
jgi:hypothetical protein